MTPHNLGAALKIIRLDKYLDQQCLSKRSGVSAGTISKIESGRRDPKMRTFLKLAEGLRVRPQSLLQSALDMAKRETMK